MTEGKLRKLYGRITNVGNLGMRCNTSYKTILLPSVFSTSLFLQVVPEIAGCDNNNNNNNNIL
jgi:hypothetical protein